MKSISIFLPILAAVVIASCKTQPIAPFETADVRGNMALVDEEQPAFPFNGIRVSLEGTSFSAITDDSGNFDIKNVPSGTYNVRFSKTGYGDVRWMSVIIEGGGNAPYYLNNVALLGWYWQQSMNKVSNTITTLLSARFLDTNLSQGPGEYIFFKGTYLGKPDQIIAYVSRYSGVSFQDGSYDSYQSSFVDSYPIWDTISKTFEFGFPIDWFPYATFHSGDSIYVAVYGMANFDRSPPFDYYDLSNEHFVLTSINQTPSPVFGLKIP